MSLWRKRNVHYSEQKPDHLVNILPNLSIKSEEAMREVQRPGQEIEQEPLASISYIPCCTDQTCPKCKATTPPQRTWVGLTDEEIKELDLSNYVQVVRIVEAKLKEKNG